MDKFIEYYLELNKSTSKSTSITLKTSLRRIEKIINLKFEDWGAETFNNYKEIVDILVEKYSVNTIIITTLAIIRFLEYKKNDEIFDDKTLENWKEVLNDLVNMRDEAEKKQQITQHEKVNWISWNEIGKKVEDIAVNDYLVGQKSFLQMRNFVMLCLYTLQPPVRIGNFLDMKIRMNTKRNIKSYNKKWNYITKMDNGKYKMVFNQYKTAKTLGKIVHIIEDETLTRILNRYINNFVIGDTLFTNSNGTKITQANYTQAVQSVSKKILGKTLSINDFRHIFLSWFQSQNPSIEEKERITKLIGQKYTSSRMELYARKNDKEEMIV